MASPAWQKSTYSGSSNACVEVRSVDDLIALRESDDGGVVIHTTRARFAALLRAAKAGEYDRRP
ncbi:DUF397 domain-containing protein [Kitasatospora sp. NPDC101176]|uniref:DUF397 domain-containing protein n=1 Tax=Kitasatospora sp. NPDC101176 TaxID=3364099 RepID=UPI0038074002